MWAGLGGFFQFPSGFVDGRRVKLRDTTTPSSGRWLGPSEITESLIPDIQALGRDTVGVEIVLGVDSIQSSNLRGEHGVH